MQLVTSIGYNGTGSSAVNDILRELPMFCELTPSNECRFFQDPDGLSDLEYNLFDCRHRLNSDYAIKRYCKYVFHYDKRNFCQIFGKRWILENKQFINNITRFKYTGYWHADLRNLTFLQKIKFYAFRAKKIIMSKILNTSRESNKNIFPKFQMYLPINDREEFYLYSRQLTNNLFQSLNKNNAQFGIVDQLVPPSNINRYFNYVQNLKVIIVDRDPRDIYLNYIPNNDRTFPKNVQQFCELFLDQRKNSSNVSDNVLYIHFEDLIYHFDITFGKILDFIGVDKSTVHFESKYFQIDKSKKNTKIWEVNKKYSAEVLYIEEHLKDYLYDNYSK